MTLNGNNNKEKYNTVLSDTSFLTEISPPIKRVSFAFEPLRASDSRSPLRHLRHPVVGGQRQALRAVALAAFIRSSEAESKNLSKFLIFAASHEAFQPSFACLETRVP